MKKFLSLILVFSFSLNALASSGASKLGLLVDEFEYATTVEWDQVDPVFIEEAKEKFYNDLKVLISEEGLTEEDVTALALSRGVPKEKLEQLKTQLKSMNIHDGRSLSEALRILSSEFYSKGANWNGSDAMAFLVPITFFICVTYAFVFFIDALDS